MSNKRAKIQLMIKQKLLLLSIYYLLLLLDDKYKIKKMR